MNFEFVLVKYEGWDKIMEQLGGSLNSLTSCFTETIDALFLWIYMRARPALTAAN